MSTNFIAANLIQIVFFQLSSKFVDDVISIKMLYNRRYFKNQLYLKTLIKLKTAAIRLFFIHLT